MTEERFKRNLEAIAAEFTVSQTAGGNWQAIAANGEVLAVGRSEQRTREMAEAEFERRRFGSRLRTSVRLGNTTRDIVL